VLILPSNWSNRAAHSSSDMPSLFPFFCLLLPLGRILSYGCLPGFRSHQHTSNFTFSKMPSLVLTPTITNRLTSPPVLTCQLFPQLWFLHGTDLCFILLVYFSFFCLQI
jgi:hypothetical protein